MAFGPLLRQPGPGQALISLSPSAPGTRVWPPPSLTKQVQSQEWHKISPEGTFSFLQPSLLSQLEWEKATWLIAAHFPVLGRASAKEALAFLVPLA